MTPERPTSASAGDIGAASTSGIAGWQPRSYPDPAVEVLDPSFAKYKLFNASVERLATGFRWCEGPV